jgi:hypothetical protein
MRLMNKNKKTKDNNVLQSNRNLSNRSIDNVNMVSQSPLNMPINMPVNNGNDIKMVGQVKSNRTI